MGEPTNADCVPPLILLDDGHRRWVILAPRYNYGGSVRFSSAPDRRYGRLCVVEGDLDEALELLQDIERGRATNGSCDGEQTERSGDA